MTRRTKSEVLAARRNAVAGGCCNRFADQQGCECLAEAADDVRGYPDFAARCRAEATRDVIEFHKRRHIFTHENDAADQMALLDNF